MKTPYRIPFWLAVLVSLPVFPGVVVTNVAADLLRFDPGDGTYLSEFATIEDCGESLFPLGFDDALAGELLIEPSPTLFSCR